MAKRKQNLANYYSSLIVYVSKNVPFVPLAVLFILLVVTTSMLKPSPSFPRPESFLIVTAPIPESDTRIPPHIKAAAVIIQDTDSGAVFYERNADSLLPPASTTKIMTALVALEHFNIDDVVTVGQIDVGGQTMELVNGEQLTVEDLLYGLLIFSANDAAEVLVRSFPGGRQAFITAMNEKAKLLHLSNTHFMNPSGLYEASHVSTARDLARLASYAEENPIFSKIVSTRSRTVVALNNVKAHKLVNLNMLLGSVPGVLGVKTGRTDEGGEALVTFIERGGHSLMIVILGSVDRFGDTKALIDWAYTSYSWGN
ncbi:D-alanyl-D-alanine carboxypeptidase [Candidatus Microgenomates bacterium]|nr:D-alanyl-D-alanine carboxypeptidase [Candidatus Microgenomates bacterium]